MEDTPQDATLFPDLDGVDLQIGPDAPPIMQQIEERATEKGVALAVAIGERIEHHGWRVKQVIEQREAQRSALSAAAMRLQYELNAVRGQIGLIDEAVTKDTEHDRQVLDQIGEYLFEKARRKSLHFGHVVLGTRKRSSKASPDVLDKDRLAALLPQYTKATLDWAAAKKDIIVRGGVAYGPDGEALPLDIVAVKPETNETRAYLQISGGPKLDLQQGDRTDGTDNDGTSDADAAVPAGAGDFYGPDDPFGDDADPTGGAFAD